MSDQIEFQHLVDLCRLTHQEMQTRAGLSVDLALVVRNWLFGWYIVDYEQSGADRATYGKQTLKDLSAALKEIIGRGYSVDRLELMRRFFMAYRQLLPEGYKSATVSRISGQAISETVSRISRSPSAGAPAVPSAHTGPEPPLIARLFDYFALGWSHYVTLLSIDSPDERRFYEIEAAANQWSVRELERQVASSLYERLALSRDKEEIRSLAAQGQVVEKAVDIVKNPLVLEFLGLERKPGYSEDELESDIIDKLEQFLLELGKGFLFEARQKRFTFDNDHFFVDLVFYNRLLRC